MVDTLVLAMHRDVAEVYARHLDALPGQLQGQSLADVLEAVSVTTLAEAQAIRDACRWLIEQVNAARVTDPAGIGLELDALLQGVLKLLDRLRRLADTLIAQGHPIPRAADLARMMADLEQDRQRFAGFFQWWTAPLPPEFSAETARQAQEAHARGETLELDEAFALIAGVDRTTWLKRVEEH